MGFLIRSGFMTGQNRDIICWLVRTQDTRPTPGEFVVRCWRMASSPIQESISDIQFCVALKPPWKNVQQKLEFHSLEITCVTSLVFTTRTGSMIKHNWFQGNVEFFTVLDSDLDETYTN